MRSAGIVIFVSLHGDMLVVQHDSGYTVVELEGELGAIRLGDRVAAEWNTIGTEDLLYDDRKLDAYFHGTRMNRAAAIRAASS
ncbi:MAG: hypothetical protein AB7Q01_17110 [Gammaproteobacteria bacterium]